MTCRDEIGTKAHRVIEERFELDFLVTHDVWIRCPTEFIFIEEVREDLIPVLFFKIDRIIRNADLIGYGDDVFIIFRRRTKAVLIRVIPVFHEDPDDVIALLF